MASVSKKNGVNLTNLRALEALKRQIADTRLATWLNKLDNCF